MRSRIKSFPELIIHRIAKLLRPIKLDSFIVYRVIQFSFNQPRREFPSSF